MKLFLLNKKRLQVTKRYLSLCLVLLLFGITSVAQQSNNISISALATPDLNACSGTGLVSVRISNISSSAISNLVFRDTMPVGINYIPNSLGGSGVTLGTSNTSGNIVSFNIANIAGNNFVDVVFSVRAACNVSTDASSIKNIYNVSWGSSSFAAPLTTANYSVKFPSISISVDSALINANCYSKFVRKLTICNGGLGPVDSLTLSDVENNAGLVIVNFSRGTISGTNTNNAKSVLKAADFMTVGNSNGKLEQGECIIVYDTLKMVGSTSPVSGTIRADWGCNTNNCNNATTNNSLIVNTTINTNSPGPNITRVLSASGIDSAANLYGRALNLKAIFKNVSSGVAVNVSSLEYVQGLRYVDTASIMLSINGQTPYHPNNTYFYSSGQAPYFFSSTPAGSDIGSYNRVIAPVPFVNQDRLNNFRVYMPDMQPGDSIVLTYTTRVAGPITKINDLNLFDDYFSTVRFKNGFTLGSPISGNLTWIGCPSGNYNLPAVAYPVPVYNGIALSMDTMKAGQVINMAGFRNFSFVDSTAITSGSPTCKTYYNLDTVQLSMTAGTMDLPFYTAKSKLRIKIYTMGGVKWDGNLSKVYARLNGSSANWSPVAVTDNTATDSTIVIDFSKANCPVTNFGTYNSYSGIFNLNMRFVNSCPGNAVKQLYMTRVYTIDTTSTDPAIESGSYNPTFSFLSKCNLLCSNGVQVLSYSHARNTFGQPDNNNDGVADASGSINMSVVNTNRITWGDSLQLKYKLLIKTTQPGGVPYLYINSLIQSVANTSDIAAATTCNGLLRKAPLQVKLTRPGVGTFTGSGVATPSTSGNSFLANLSLQSTGGVTIPGIVAYQDGDTLEVIEPIQYWTPHMTWNPTDWNFIHTPYVSTVANPTGSQQIKCDSITCARFQTIDMSYSYVSDQGVATACSDSLSIRLTIKSNALGFNCGDVPFPGEVRSVSTITKQKFGFGFSQGFFLQSVRFAWTRNLKNCQNSIVEQNIPTSLYTISGDTVIFDYKQIVQYFGYDITDNNLFTQTSLRFNVKYVPPGGYASACTRDHVAIPVINLTTNYTASNKLPTDTTSLQNRPSTTLYPFINLPGANTNTVTAVSSVSVLQSINVIPITYTKGTPAVSGLSGNDFLAIPARPGILIDSVRDNVTGQKVPLVSGSNSLYNMSYLPVSTSRALNVFTRVTSCNSDTLTFYADRTPCSGMPLNWSTYACKSSAASAATIYQTYAGELQMTDTLYTLQKDLCTTDTVQFDVFNSQTQDANNIKISFKMPSHMLLVPGLTQLKKGNGTFVNVADPVISGGIYTWSMSSLDTLYKTSASPNNKVSLRIGISTECGYASGSQLTGCTVSGNVACGPITSIITSNPPALKINGAPALSYLTNVKGTITPVTGCSVSGTGYDYRVSMKISGTTSGTGTNDNVTVTLPQGYKFVSYSSVATGSVHAPVAAPTSSTLPDGTTTQLSWSLPQGVMPGDSIIFTFKYNEVSTAVNKCAVSASRYSDVNTYINSGVYCATTGTNCNVAIQSGKDTMIAMQSLKPSVTTTTNTVTWGNAVAPTSVKSYLYISGTLLNSGTAAVPTGTNIVMEPFMDLDNSGTISSGDYAFTPFVYNGGLAMGGTHSYTYTDSVAATACSTCSNKSLLLRFSNNPSAPAGVSQCMCDSVKVSSVMPNAIPLAITLDDFTATADGCNHAKLQWNTLNEIGKNLYFLLEGSVNGRDFFTLATVAANGTISGSKYEKVVALPAVRSFFRIAMLSDGDQSYSKLLTVKSDCYNSSTIMAFPNPFNNMVIVKGTKKGDKILLMDVSGRKILAKDASGDNTDVLDMKGLASGSYLLTVTDVTGNVTRIKLAKN